MESPHTAISISNNSLCFTCFPYSSAILVHILLDLVFSICIISLNTKDRTFFSVNTYFFQLTFITLKHIFYIRISFNYYYLVFLLEIYVRIYLMSVNRHSHII